MEKDATADQVLSDHCGLDRPQAQQPAANEIPAYRRGDIPIFHDCDDRGKPGIIDHSFRACFEVFGKLSDFLNTIQKRLRPSH